MAAADALFVFFDIAASTLIFIKPAGGGIHCVVFGTFTLFAICYMERFLCEHEFVPILWNDIHHAAHNESSACGGFEIFFIQKYTRHLRFYKTILLPPCGMAFGPKHHTTRRLGIVPRHGYCSAANAVWYDSRVQFIFKKS
jgi:hypothetical protein